jgi:hypothetical protein
VQAQVSIGIGIGAPVRTGPPACRWGYYDYAPYRCAPYGFYGQGYFYNGMFLGVGPWSNWGYSHGWGQHRFVESRGGRYIAGHDYSHERMPVRRYPVNRGNGGNHGYVQNRGRGQVVHSAPAARGHAPGGAAHGGEHHR